MIGLLALGCGFSADSSPVPAFTRIPEGTDGRPNAVLVLFPDPDLDPVRRVARSREMWRDLESEAFSLHDPGRFPQPPIPAEWVATGQRAISDLVEPLPALTVWFDPPDDAPDDRVQALILIEMLPDTTITRLRGSDAFTETIYEADTRLIRRAVIRLPLWILSWESDDFANFLAHEFGHALGRQEHLEEMADRPEGETWFWDRLMTIPIPRGQAWQPATVEDILAIAGGRYTLRDGWDADRHLRYPIAIAYNPHYPRRAG